MMQLGITRRPLAPPRVLVFGHLGMGNIGDEAMLPGVLQRVAELYPGAELSIATGARPNSDLAPPEGCRLSWIRRSPLPLLKAILATDVFVVAGGTHLCSVVGNRRHDRGILRHLLIYSAARLAGLKVLLLGVGLGPFYSTTGRLLAAMAVRRATLISVRDQRSLDQLRTVLKFSRTANCCDEPALRLPLPKRKLAGPHLGLSVLQYHALYESSALRDQKLEDRFAELIRQWLALYPMAKVSLLCFYSADNALDDRAIADRIAARFKDGRVRVVDPEGQLKQCLAAMREFTHFVSMRYHAQVLAWRFGIPQIVVAYHEKNRGFVASTRMESSRVLDISEFLEDHGTGRFRNFFLDSGDDCEFRTQDAA